VDFTTTEDESKQLIIDAQHQKLIEESERMVKQTKNLVAYLETTLMTRKNISQTACKLDKPIKDLGGKTIKFYLSQNC
jgi:hypothetical protein